MNRRKILRILSAGALAAVSLLAAAQQPGKVYRIGYVSSGAPTDGVSNLEAFKQGLRELGWMEGQNIAFETRYTMGDNRRHAELMADVLRLKVDVIVTTSTPGAQAAKAATQETPIVFQMVSDPVASGVVTNLARPGGNVTGWSNMLPATTRKLLELLREVSPKVSRVAVIHDPDNAGKQLEVKVLREDARSVGVTIEPIPIRTLDDVVAALGSLAQKRIDGLVVLQDAMTQTRRTEILELALKSGLPAIYQTGHFVEAGGMMSYGLNIPTQFRRGASYVDRILRGAKPGDLPVEQPTNFEFVVNKKTASTLGVTFPPPILLRADRVIE